MNCGDGELQAAVNGQWEWSSVVLIFTIPAGLFCFGKGKGRKSDGKVCCYSRYGEMAAGELCVGFEMQTYWVGSLSRELKVLDPLQCL
jgi:hypothetical protein